MEEWLHKDSDMPYIYRERDRKPRQDWEGSREKWVEDSSNSKGSK